MQLNGALADEFARTPDLHLHRRHLPAPFQRIRLLRHHRRQHGHGTRFFQGDHHLSRAMLQGLESPDGTAELLARLQIIQGQFLQRIHRAKRFTGQRGDGFIHHAIH